MRALTVIIAGAAASAQAQSVSEPVKARVNALVAQCAAAGGQLGQITGQGQFVIPRDFNGDGRTDFLISEGNFPCAGKPTLFRPDGLARVELWLGEGSAARLAFADRLLAYRVLDGRPTVLQIARRAPACGGPARCGDELRWNAVTRSFEEVPTDGRKVSARPATGAASNAALPYAVPAAGPAPAALALLPDAEARHKAKCRKETLAANPQAAKWVDGECAEGWKRAQATGPAADAFLAVLPATGSGPAPLQTAKSRMTGVRWGNSRPGQPTVGTLGELEMQLEGAGAPTAVRASWWKKGTLIPWDMAGALEARGAKLTLVGCEKLGIGEGRRAWSGTVTGRQPFSLAVDSREAPTANADSSYSAAITLNGKTPPRGDLSSCRDF